MKLEHVFVSKQSGLCLINLLRFSVEGKMHSLDQVDGVDAKEYTDIAVANYGSTAPALGQMTLKQCSGVSSEYNERRGGDLNASTAQRLMNDGYGWFMGICSLPK